MAGPLRGESSGGATWYSFLLKFAFVGRLRVFFVLNNIRNVNITGELVPE